MQYPTVVYKLIADSDTSQECDFAGYVPKEPVSDVRSHNVGSSNYSKYKIQVWDIWKEYNLNPWDADIVKRVLRTKATDGRRLDYEKIIHICQERIRQIDNEKI